MKALCFAFVSAIVAAGLAASPVISVDRTHYAVQTGASTLTYNTKPFSLNFHVRGDGSNMMADWGPAFYKPGSGGTPQSGSSDSTNTGTLNFPASPNNHTDFMFIHDFATNAELTSFYGNGAYGVKLLGSGAPTPNVFTDGLVFESEPTYPSVAPQVTSVDNGAKWIGNKLRIKRTGTTTIRFNSFPEYSSNTYGSIITAGFYNATGPLAAAAKESGSLPMGDSTEDSAPIFQSPVTDIAVDGSWFVPGRTYTLEVQYATLGGRPEEDLLNGIEFQGVSALRKVTTLQIGYLPAAYDFDDNGTPEVMWQNIATGARVLWMMNGTALASVTTLAAEPDTNWRICDAADFDLNGTPDIIWQNISTGARRLWMMNGTTRSSVVSLGSDPDVNWVITCAADFDNNDSPDLVWQNVATGARVVWMMSGTSLVDLVSLGSDPDVNWRICDAADFDGNGTPDIIWQNISTGARALWLMEGTVLAQVISLGGDPDVNWRITGAADFDANGTPDIIWQNISTGARALWLMEGTVLAEAISLGGDPDVNWRIAN